MRALPFSLSLALLVSACSGSSPTVVGGNLKLSASTSSAVADGVGSIVVSVSGTGTGPFTVTTTLGTFDDGSQLLTQNSLPFDVTLHSCNAAQTASCAGSATVRATDAKGITGAVTVMFTRGGTQTGSLSVSVNPTTPVVADGTTTVKVTVAGTASGEVTLTTTKGHFDNGTATTTGTPTFEATLHSCDARVDTSCVGSATLHASDGAGATGSAAVTFSSPNSAPGTVALGQISLVNQLYSVQGVRYSGFQEVNILTFQALDTSGQSYPAGLTVRFDHQSLGESFVGNTPQCTASVPSTCSATGVTDASGKVTVTLVSGTVAGIVSVSATATDGDVTVSTSSRSLAVIGAKASGAHLFVNCSPRNAPALLDDNCLTSFYNGSVTCTAYFGDRFGNVLGIGLLATFVSEAGAFGPPAMTKAFDPANESDQTDSLGKATNTLAIAGARLPRNVAPVTGEPSITVAADPCGSGASWSREHNPRDGLNTIIVMAHGEEGFFDRDGDGAHDTDEPYIDLGEPFVDADDDGAYTAGEEFVDLNGSGEYDGPNLEWDDETTIWAETRVLYTGVPAYGPGQSYVNPDHVVVDSSAGGLTASQDSVDFYLTDVNFNPLSPTKTTYPSPTTLNGVVTASIAAPPASVDHLGLGWTQQYCSEPPGTTPAACSNVCTSVPCYVRGFLNPKPSPTHGGLSVQGGSKAGVDTVLLNVKVDYVELVGVLTVQAVAN